jgi:hypothetical protein
MPLPRAHRVALLLGSIVGVLLISTSPLHISPQRFTTWQLVLLYGVGLVVPIIGSVWSQDLLESFSTGNDSGAARYFTGFAVAMAGCPLQWALVGCALWELPPTEQLKFGLSSAFIIYALGIVIGAPLMAGLLQLHHSFRMLPIEDLNYQALQIALALLAPVELFACWAMLVPQ